MMATRCPKSRNRYCWSPSCSKTGSPFRVRSPQATEDELRRLLPEFPGPGLSFLWHGFLLEQDSLSAFLAISGFLGERAS